MLTCRISPGAIAVFTDRTGGVSSPPFDSLNLATHVGDVGADVRENRARLAARLRTTPVWMDQVHGAEVRVLATGAAETAGECDAVVLAGADGHAPAVLVADCVPLLLADETGATAVMLDPLEGLAPDATSDYVSVMEANLATLMKGQNCG